MLEELEDFLKDIPPFNLLPGKALKGIIPTLTVQKFSKEDLILSPDGPPTRFLYPIRSGAVKFTIPGKDDSVTDQLVDMHHEKEFFGGFSLWSNRPCPFTITAKKKTVCYLLKKEVFTRLLDDYANFLLYFTMGPSKGFRSTGPSGGFEKGSDLFRLETDSLLFLVRVRDIMKTQVITCPQGQTVVDAARLMTRRRVGSLIVLDEKDQPMGIITDGDMRQKVIASGLQPDIPVAQIMSSPLLSVPPEAFYFEALIAMIRHLVKYLPIIDGGKPAGVLSARDLVVSQGKELDNYINPDELSLIQRSVLKTAFKFIARLQSRMETRFGLLALRTR
jgi:CBS domain-containing protein